MSINADVVNSTKLLIVEDHAMVREMLDRLLRSQTDFDIVGSVSNIADSEATLQKTNPDMVLLDVMLPDGSGMDWAKALKSKQPNINIMFLTAVDREESVIEAIKMGAEGYMLKTASCEGLIDAVRSVAAGKCIFDPAVTTTILQRLVKEQTETNINTKGSKDTIVDHLSPKEREIVSLVRQGLSNKEIAVATSTSLNTVKTHMRRIFRRLGISSRNDLS